MDLGEMIRDYRRKYALSQREFGERIGITKEMISYIETYSKTAGNKVLRKVALELQLPIIEVSAANLEQNIKVDKLRNIKRGE